MIHPTEAVQLIPSGARVDITGPVLSLYQTLQVMSNDKVQIYIKLSVLQFRVSDAIAAMS